MLHKATQNTTSMIIWDYIVTGKPDQHKLEHGRSRAHTGVSQIHDTTLYILIFLRVLHAEMFVSPFISTRETNTNSQADFCHLADTI